MKIMDSEHFNNLLLNVLNIIVFTVLPALRHLRPTCWPCVFSRVRADDSQNNGHVPATTDALTSRNANSMSLTAAPVSNARRLVCSLRWDTVTPVHHRKHHTATTSASFEIRPRSNSYSSCFVASRSNGSRYPDGVAFVLHVTLRL